MALIFGLNGACRGCELVNLKVEDVENHSNELLLINVKETKTKKNRSFIVQGQYTKIIHKYQALRPTNMENNRFFINYRNGKCTRQAIGKNKISNMPKEIAKYLKLKDVELYTGHCFRRTSATFLADSGADITSIKRHGGWSSDRVAEGYIESSMANKTILSSQINKNIKLNPSEPQPSTSGILSSSVTHDAPPPLSPTYTIYNETQVPQTQEQRNTQINSSTINVPNKNVTLSINNWTNVSNVNFYF